MSEWRASEGPTKKEALVMLVAGIASALGIALVLRLSEP